MNYQQIFQFILLFFLPILGYSQYHCGDIYKKELPKNLSQIDQENLQFDRFGNAYLLDELNIVKPKKITKNDINTGYFDVVFNNFPETIQTPGHPNFGEDIRPVICQVFADLSAIILQRTKINACGETEELQKINIQIDRNICNGMPGCDPATFSVAGTGTPFYSFLDAKAKANCGIILESTLWKKMNSNEIFYPEFSLDGKMSLNIDNIDFDYGLDLDQPVDSDKLDLYSIVLHEAMHILGFASKLDFTGLPFNNSTSFSRYDQLLGITESYQANEGSQNIQQLLASDCEQNCLALNPTITNLESLIGMNCNNGAYDIVIGNVANAPIYGSDNGTLSAVNAFSHLRESCNGSNEDYVMDPAINKGDDERTISNAELSILCQLGYKINESILDCDNCFAAANYDHSHYTIAENNLEFYESCCFEPFYTLVDQVITIQAENLLCNDFPSEELELTDMYYLDGNINPANLIKIDQNTYEFSAPKMGSYRIYYTVRNCSCYLSTSSFDILVSDGLPTCENTICDNLICIGDFEDFEKINDYYMLEDRNHFFLMEDTYQNTPDICVQADNRFSDLANIIGPEAMLYKLDYPVLPGCSLELTMDAVSRQDATGLLEVYGSETKPCHPWEAFIKQACSPSKSELVINDCGDSNYVPFCLLKEEPINNFGGNLFDICPSNELIFENYSWTIENDFDVPIQYLVMYNIAKPSVIWIDNIEVRAICPPNVSFESNEFMIQADLQEFIDFDICLSNEAFMGFESADFEVSVVLPSGIQFSDGGNFVNGVASLSNVKAGDCETLFLSIIADEMGTYEISVHVTAEDLCFDEEYTIEIQVDDDMEIQEFDLADIPVGSQYRLVNIVGQVENLSIEQWDSASRNELQNSHFPGIYFLQIYNQKSLLYTEKIVISH